jgi:hypothetical protein
MVDNMKETGKKIIWMEWVSTPGKMAENLKDNIKETKNMEMEFTHGLTEENMTVSGQMEGNMAEESIFLRLDNLEKVYGKLAKESSGWMTYKMIRCSEYIYYKFKYLSRHLYSY